MIASCVQSSWDVILRLLSSRELKGISTTNIPIQWRKAYNDAIKAINGHDFVNKGYESIYVHIEKAYNIYKLASLKEVKQIGLDNISPNTPYNIFTEYAKKIPGMMEALPSKEFFDSLKEFVPLVALKSGAHYTPTYKYVNISFDKDTLERMVKSPWYRKCLFYHEFGHAFDHQIKLKSNNELIKVYNDWKKIINAGEGERLKEVVKVKLNAFSADFNNYKGKTQEQISELTQIGKNEEADRLKKELFAKAAEHDILRKEFHEKLGAFTDCLQAAIDGHEFIYPRGIMSLIGRKISSLPNLSPIVLKTIGAAIPYSKKLRPNCMMICGESSKSTWQNLNQAILRSFLFVQHILRFR